MCPLRQCKRSKAAAFSGHEINNLLGEKSARYWLPPVRPRELSTITKSANGRLPSLTIHPIRPIARVPVEFAVETANHRILLRPASAHTPSWQRQFWNPLNTLPIPLPPCPGTRVGCAVWSFPTPLSTGQPSVPRRLERATAACADPVSAKRLRNARTRSVSAAAAGISRKAHLQIVHQCSPDAGNVQAFSIRGRRRTPISPGIGSVKLPDA